ncbi:MAG: proton-conducting transporter membrane subunit [Pyrobaculum sp.]
MDLLVALLVAGYAALRVVVRFVYVDLVYISALAYLAYSLGRLDLAAFSSVYILATVMVAKGKFTGQAGMASALSYTGAILISSGLPHLQALGFAMATMAPALLLVTEADRGSLEGLFRYLVISTVVTNFLIIGLSTRGGTFGEFFILMAVIAEMGAAPLYVWVVDVYGRSSPAGLAALASLPKLAAGFVLMYVAPELPPAAFYAVGAVSMLLGNLGALTSGDLRRVLAYSTVAHAGFALFAYPLSPAVSVLLILADAVGKMALFSHLSAGSARWPAVVMAMNQIGIPPALGFWPKLLIIVLTAQHLGPVAAAYLLGNVVLSVPYYFRVARDLPEGALRFPAAVAVFTTVAGAAAPLWLAAVLS